VNAGASGGLRACSRRLWQRRLADDRGSSTLEFAIIVPALFLAIFTCVQVALWSYGRSIALNAAHEAVNAQRVFGAAPGVGQARAEAFIAAQGDSLLDSTVTVEIRGNEVFATVRGQTLSLVPGFATDVTQVASGPVEEFRP
jgi:Flp pilus assembly protein TadG